MYIVSVRQRPSRYLLCRWTMLIESELCIDFLSNCPSGLGSTGEYVHHEHKVCCPKQSGYLYERYPQGKTVRHEDILQTNSLWYQQ